MFYFIKTLFSYFLSQNTDEVADEEKENFLAEQLLDIELRNQDENSPESIKEPKLSNNVNCFQKTGVITFIKNNEYVLIDGIFYYDISSCSIPVNLNDKVMYLGYKDENDSIKIVRIVDNCGSSWADEEASEENEFKVIEHFIIGEVDSREERLVYMKDVDLKFNLDNVNSYFVPIKGDWLELKCTVQWDEKKPSDISAAQVLQVKSFKALRTKIKPATVTEWTGEWGTCDRNIFFNQHCLLGSMEVCVGTRVMIEAIESSQGNFTWRVIKLIFIENGKQKEELNESNEDELSLPLEKENNIDITYPIIFDNIKMTDTESLSLDVTNNSDKAQFLNKWIILSKKRDSQINVSPILQRPRRLYPGQTFSFTITCTPKFFGRAKECLIIMFKGFQAKRFIEVNVVDLNNGLPNKTNGSLCYGTQSNNIETMRNMRKNNNNNFIPGVRLVKPPAFVPVRLGMFNIPDKVWSAVLGDSNQTIYSTEYSKIIARIEDALSCLTQELNIHNYTDKWHNLVFIEEIQANIAMRAYDMPKAFLIRSHEYLGIEIEGLAERRPSLIKSDRVLVKDIWNDHLPKYEGYIHDIRGNLVLIKFHNQFHETYNGGDVSIEFHFSRSSYRRSHQAINLAISNLGSEILFPTRIMSREPQISTDILSNIVWFNNCLNDGQKNAVLNILLGESRPLPYCIYGPPGTGKTVTVVETILQILKHIPDSRILVATPSNSAANLITERLVKYKDNFAGSVIRLIANYLIDSDNIPDTIKPFCATLDIAREETAKCNYKVNNDGINMNCRTSFVGRHRVTIGTCYCIGTLAMMGLPRGHFTHIVIDEAGQATEPEIMIPMTFTDKENGQIILAGDPMQLGPVVLSKYAKEFGMEESFLCRILETFPYQKDFDAFKDGFNKKLLTKLNDNYRSLVEVLTLPSKMFYDGSLVPKFPRDLDWIKATLTATSKTLGIANCNEGGIFVYGIRGVNARAEDSPSWYNPQEASMVALTTCKLYKNGINVDDIGIITPYIAQIRHLRLVFDAMGLPQPKIGTVEEFQGQERPVIIISTVRSSENYIEEDVKHSLGFLKSPKRLNVALTRAQIVAILFCNPHLLSLDPLWRRVIEQAVQEDKYQGCNLPNSLEKPSIIT